MTPRRWLWLGWVVLVFGLLNLHGPSIESFQLASDPPTITTDELSERPSVLERIGIDLRDDYGVRLYYSLAQATLGRPYQARYVRPWDGAGNVSPKGGVDVEDPPPVTPPRPLRPWRDFLLEYPPGMLATILAPALFTSDRGVYFILFSLEMELLLTLAIYFSVRTAERIGADGGKVLVQAIILTAALGVVGVRRYDPSVAFAISGSIYALASRRAGLLGAALALGVALKGAPLLLAPIFAFWFVARRDWGGLKAASLSFVVWMAIAAIGYLVIAWPRVFDSFAYHADRPLQMESIYGALLMIVRVIAPDDVTFKYAYGSYNIISTYEPLLRTIATVAVLMGVAGSYVLAFRRIAGAGDDRERLTGVILACCACLVAVISLGKVSSPQYLIWLIPVGALAGALSAGSGQWFLVIACALTQTVYPFLYTTIIANRLPGLDGLIILTRHYTLWRWLFKIVMDPVRKFQAIDAPGVHHPVPIRADVQSG